MAKIKQTQEEREAQSLKDKELDKKSKKKKGLTEDEIGQIDLGQKLAWGTLGVLCVAIVAAISWKVYQANLPKPDATKPRTVQTKPSKPDTQLKPFIKGDNRYRRNEQLEPFIGYIGETERCEKVYRWKTKTNKIATLCIFSTLDNDWVLSGTSEIELPDWEYSGDPGSALARSNALFQAYQSKHAQH